MPTTVGASPKQMRECQNCYGWYAKEDSTASADVAHLFCSAECEKTDAEWLASGNEIVKNAEAENPGIFNWGHVKAAFETQSNVPATKPAEEHNQDINKLLNLLNIKRPEGE